MPALTCVARQHLDLAILDVMLPDLDGFTLCQKIREEHLFPILMLTARVEDMDKIMGLTLGADDYITKPFNPLELVESGWSVSQQGYVSYAFALRNTSTTLQVQYPEVAITGEPKTAPSCSRRRKR